MLLKLADLVERDADEFASIEALDAGSLYAFGGQTHKGFTTEALRYFAGWADKIDGKSLNTAGGFGVTFREPIGVCGIIVPWNAPL